MNRILFEREELDADGCVVLRDGRARHMRSVLHVAVGDRLRVGVIDGPVGEAEVLGVDGGSISLSCHCHEAQSAANLDLILALPRPKVLKRLLAPLASLGVRNLYLVNSEKVERNYFDTHVLDGAFMRERFLEGLMQAGATQMPAVRVVKRLRPFLEDELADRYTGWSRLLLHPRGGRQIGDIAFRDSHGTVLALGPEGGWSDFELSLFETTCRFEQVRFGWRVLRSDVACLAVIGAVTALQPGSTDS
jgi:16S rRNA (uracil1498-N3)-methyltransferase